MSTIQIISDTPVTPPREHTTQTTVANPVLPELELKTIGRIMGIETETDLSQYASELEILRDYARGRSDKSTDGLRSALQELELKLGTPPISEKRIRYVARYAYLLQEQQSLNAELKRLEGNK